MEEEYKSEFGKGCLYNLGLFLAHEAMYYERMNRFRDMPNLPETMIDNAPMMWFNGAGDHLYDFEIPEGIPENIKERLEKFQSKVLSCRNVFDQEVVTEKDVFDCLQEAKSLLMWFDKNILKVKSEEAQWK